MAGSTWRKSDVNRSFFLCLAACRTRSSACDTLARSCARRVLCWSAFPLVSVLGSTGSATDCSALFVGFMATINGIRLLGSVHRRLRLLVFPTRTEGVHPPAKPEASRFPCKELPHMLRVFDHAGLGGRSRYRASHVAFRDSDHVGVRRYQALAARWLAYALPCQRFAGILADTAA